MAYPFKSIEPKWQKRWETEQVFKATLKEGQKKYYILDMFPYPSSDGLHVGHVEGYTASDIVSRFKRCRGFNVLHPMGWDAYGLPAEQFAIQTGIHPEETTQKAIKTFRRQLKSLGFSYDWQREVSTCDPKYYRHTQALFIKLFERGLAYQKEVAVNWCPALLTVLANEEVIDGKSERGGHPVERRPMLQWMLKITDYAEKLLEGLNRINWPARTIEAQRNWIGKSIGLKINFSIPGSGHSLEIYTTRPDTIYGATFMVLAPEHPLVSKITTTEYRAKVEDYQRTVASRSELARQSATEKTGVFTGAYVLNPVNQQRLPIWVADYVLQSYGTGAIMAVPGHDERDFAFAQKFQIPVKRVLLGGELPFIGDGQLTNSGILDGLDQTAAIEKISDHLEERRQGKREVHYRLRDWLFSRQRYWGEPFPLIHYPKAGLATVPVNELPVLLPPLSSYAPTADGKAPLTRAPKEWLQVKHPDTGEIGRREADTMPGSAASSWYFLRFTDPHNAVQPFAYEAQKYWMPVDLYLGGAEHTVGHLLYARFWQKVLFDAGMVANDEPFSRLIHQGMILGEDGEKMSKSRGNVISPDRVIEEVGADSLRLYEMFMGPIDHDKPWTTHGISGVARFLSRLWALLHPEDKFKVDEKLPSAELIKLTHQTIAKVTHDIEALTFNTAISQMMILSNAMIAEECRARSVVKSLIQCLAPFAPHFAEEIWEKLGESGLVSTAPWPSYDAKLAAEEKVTVAIQVNGKTRGSTEVAVGSDQKTVEGSAKAVGNVKKLLTDKSIKRVIFVKDRIINFIIEG